MGLKCYPYVILFLKKMDYSPLPNLILRTPKRNLQVLPNPQFLLTERPGVNPSTQSPYI